MLILAKKKIGTVWIAMIPKLRKMNPKRMTKKMRMNERS